MCFLGLLKDMKVAAENASVCARGEICSTSPFPHRLQLFGAAQCIEIYVQNEALVKL